jgi:hypothetical protein
MNRLEELIRCESANSGLAFREHAYREAERTELLRDLLSLANAAVSGPRFLLVGVRDVPGGERALTGLTNGAWSELKRLLSAVLTEAIEPPLGVTARALKLDGVLIGMLRLGACEDAPYLLSQQAGRDLMPGAGWVRRGINVLPLVRSDLKRMFEARPPGPDREADVRLGFGLGSSEIADEITLPVMPLDARPSVVAADKLRELLEAQASAREMLGRTETQLARLMHARLFGADAVYESHGDESLRARIAGTAEEYADADAHYEFELRAHPLRVLICNGNGAALHAVTVMLTLPRIDGISVAERLYPAADAPPTDEGYPRVHAKPRTIEIRADVDAVPRGRTVSVFRHAPRLCVRETAAGKTIPVDYALHARELREPLRDTLLIKIA